MNNRLYGSPAKKSFLIIATVATFIFLLTFLVYTPSLKNDFINWDDGKYVYENANIKSLNLKSFYWMLTSSHSSNWHPLTWLSHAIDYVFWKLDPLGHHLTNVILHGLNSLFLFFLAICLMLKAEKVNGIVPALKRPFSTNSKYLIAAGTTALLFGLHPLHVEPVAWVAERKELLCTFFFLLTLLFYLSYTASTLKRPRLICFVMSLLLFLFALMSKPMAITLPVILLLLDIYPLKRLKLHSNKNLSVLLEKIPFIVLSIASGIITILAQRSGGSIKSFEHLPIGFRLLNALHTPVFYLKKMILPFDLIPFYPYPEYIYPLVPQYIISGILILSITGGCLWAVKRGKYLFFTAWSYYLITLLPVIGIIQVGGQAAADRYTYLPGISLFLLAGTAMAWGWDKISPTRFKTTFKGLLLVCLCTVTFLLGYLTINQINIWKNPEIFWNHVISAFPKTFPEAYNNLGNYYAKTGRLEKAIPFYEKALSLNSNFTEAYNNLGLIYAKKGRFDEAIAEYKKAININPHVAEIHTNLGLVYAKKDRFDEAITEYKKALAINPNILKVHNNLGIAYYQKGAYDKAIYHYKQAIAIKSDYGKAHNNLAAAYYSKGNYELAIVHCDRAVKFKCRVHPKLLELLKPYR